MIYATVADVEARFRALSEEEKIKCTQLLADASLLIDSYNSSASDDIKKIVSCAMVIRAGGFNDDDSGNIFPTGATQGSMSALGYSQSWTIGGGGSANELYLSKTERRMLGINNRIGSHSPIEAVI